MSKKLFCKNECDYDCLFTPWSFIHIYSGIFSMILMQNLNLNYPMSILLTNFAHGIYELKDYYFTYHIRREKTTRDNQIEVDKNTLYNSMGDQISCNIGIGIYILFKESFSFPKKTNSHVLLISGVIYIALIILWWVLFYLLELG